MTGPTSTARNRHDAEPSASALCRELLWDSGEAPEWIQLMPIGPAVDGRDGRAWTMSDPEGVVAATSLPMVLDWEHSTEIKAPKGDEAPAAAWLVELDVVREESAGRVPGIWGRVDWTPRGASSVRSREYRFVSPVFQHTKGENEVLRLLNAALTNRPNLDLTALNSRDARQETTNAMTPEQLKALCAALGLPPDSSVETILATAQNATSRVGALTSENTALNARASTLVTRADLESALNRAQVAEGELATIKAEAFKERVDTVIKAACAAGKLAPSTLDYHRATCVDAAALNRFMAFVDTLPAIVGGDPTPRKVEVDPATAANSLSAEDKATAKALNISEEDFSSFKARNTQQENG